MKRNTKKPTAKRDTTTLRKTKGKGLLGSLRLPKPVAHYKGHTKPALKCKKCGEEFDTRTSNLIRNFPGRFYQLHERCMPAAKA